MKRYQAHFLIFGLFLLFLVLAGASCSREEVVISISRFGAVGDEQTNNREAIQEAIDRCAEMGGGRVHIPAGNFLTGNLRLKSNINLHLDPGACLIALSEKEAYELDGIQYHDLLICENSSNLTLSGEGSIIGNGQSLSGVMRDNHDPLPAFRTGLINITNCENVKITGLSLEYSDFWTLTLDSCRDVRIDGIRIKNNYFHANSDGIDPVNCRNVIIANCIITAGDDCICLKESAEDVVVSNCILSTPATAIKIGTATEGIFRNLIFSNTIVRNSMAGIGIFMKDGGSVENIQFSNMTIEDIQDTMLVNSGIVNQQVPIFIDVDLRNSTSNAGTIRNISFNNIDIYSYTSVLIQGMESKPIEGIFMSDIRFYRTRQFDFSGRRKPKGIADSKFYLHDDSRLTQYASIAASLVFAYVENLNLNNIWVIPQSEDLLDSPMSTMVLVGKRGQKTWKESFINRWIQ